MFLSSYEYDEFDKPIKILSISNETLDARNIFIASVSPPVPGADYGLGEKRIDKLYLVGRFHNEPEINEFPFEVHVLIPKSTTTKTITSLKQLQNIGWASVYNNEKDAKEHKI